MAKKHILFLSIFFLCLSTFLLGQPCHSTSFKTLFYQNDSTLYPDNTIDDINVPRDSAYLIGGSQIAKTDLNGNRIWNGAQYTNFSGADAIPYIAPDGEYYIVTATFNLLHIDSNETVLWQKQLLDTNCNCNPEVKHITQTSDGGFIITGSKSILDTSFYRDRIYIIKTNSSGDTVWTNTLGKSPFNNKGYYTQETSDGGYLVLANIENIDTNAIQTFKIGVIKLNSNGQEQWSKTAGRSIFSGAKIKGLKTNDGDCAIVASIDSNLVATYFVKINENGNEVFDTVFLNKKFNGGIIQLINGDYLIGMQDSLSKTDGNTNAILWSKSYIGSRGENIPINSIRSTCDNGLIMGGTSAIFNSTDTCHGAINIYNDYYSYLIKTDSTYVDAAITSLAEQTGKTENDFIIFPNPFHGQTNILFEKEITNATFKIIDMLGKEVKSIHFSGKLLTIERDELKGGIYFVQVIDDKKNMITKKIVIH